jgi:hypothetical protein
MQYPIITQDDRPLSNADRKAIYGFLSAYAKENQAKSYVMSETGFTDEEMSEGFDFKYGLEK